MLSQLQSDAAAFAASTGTATAQAQAAFDGLKGSLRVVRAVHGRGALHVVGWQLSRSGFARETRYRLGMARERGAMSGDAISGLADAGEQAIRDLVAFPLRMLVGALDTVEAQLHKVADTLREIDPLDERVVALERRVRSLEKQATGRGHSSRTTTATRRKRPTTASVEPERVEHSTGQPVPGSDTGAGQTRAETQAAGTTEPAS